MKDIKDIEKKLEESGRTARETWKGKDETWNRIESTISGKRRTGFFLKPAVALATVAFLAFTIMLFHGGNSTMEQDTQKHWFPIDDYAALVTPGETITDTSVNNSEGSDDDQDSYQDKYYDETETDSSQGFLDYYEYTVFDTGEDDYETSI